MTMILGFELGFTDSFVQYTVLFFCGAGPLTTQWMYSLVTQDKSSIIGEETGKVSIEYCTSLEYNTPLKTKTQKQLLLRSH